MKRSPVLTVVALFLTLSSCKKPIKTMTLQASTIETIDHVKQDEAEWSCWPATCFHSHGLGCSVAVGANQIGAGFNYRADPGTKPCNCWWYVDCVFRGAVRFDLGALQNKNVVGAQLSWASKGPCAAKLYVPHQNPGTFGLSTSGVIASPWSPNSSGAGQLEAGNTVRNWVLGNAPNHGWIIAGPDETFPNWVWESGDAEIGPPNVGTSKCTAAMGPFQLVVQYTE